MARAQIATIQYQVGKSSPRSNFGLNAPVVAQPAAPSNNNNNPRLLGLPENNEEGSQEDQEARRNRNINLADLQRLLA